MTAPELSHRYQWACLWPATGGVNRYGVPIIGGIIELRVRWDGNQSRALDPKGNTITVDATVITRQPIAINSRLWLGSLQDLWDAVSGTGTGTMANLEPVSDWMEVKTYNEVPDIRDRRKYREAGLCRFNKAVTV